MITFYTVSWILMIIISTTFTIITWKEREFDTFFITWFATLTLGWMLGWVFTIFFLYIIIFNPERDNPS